MNYSTDHKLQCRSDVERTIVAAVEVGMSILVRKLDLPGLTLRFERMGGWGGSDACHAGKWTPHRKLVKINIRNLYGQSLETILSVLGHEMRHAAQTAHGVLDSIEDEEFKVGSHKYYNRRYYNLPREKDARKYQEVYARLVMDDPLWKTEYAAHLTDRTDDAPATLNDHNATLVTLGFTSDDRPHIKLFRDKDDSLYWYDMRLVTDKKATKRYLKMVWNDHRETLMTQPWVYEQRDATIEDLVC